MRSTQKLKLADIAFLGVADLQRSRPNTEEFGISEVIRHIEAMGLPIQDFHPASLSAHLSLHCVANKAPDGGNYRMLFSPRKAKIRLLRATDTVHANRTGKMFPDPSEVPDTYHDLITWAKELYDSSPAEESAFDILRSIVGTYRYTAEGQSVEDYVKELRKGWDE